MASERDFELLDDYLANRLSGDEKVAFERRLEGDPELKREFTVQQNIVEGIKRARVADLKAMLNNTPIPAPSFGETMLAKIGAAAVVTGLIVTGVWFFTKDKQAESNEPAPITEQAPESSQPETEEEPNVQTVQPQEPVAQEETPSSSKEEKKSAVKRSKDTSTESAPVKPEEKELFDPSQELAETSPAVVAEEPTAEQIRKAPVRESVGSSVNPKSITNDRKYTFHYQFQGGDLLLYGPEVGTYEILEFFIGKDTTVYLYHKNKYYLLDRNTTEEPAKLKPVEDRALINVLNEKRNQK